LYPGIFFIHDTRAQRAQQIAADVLKKLHNSDSSTPLTSSGNDWSAALFAPPAHEPTCGADIYQTDGDVLLWAGEMFLPQSWLDEPNNSNNPARAISSALLQQLRNRNIEALAEIDGTFCGAWYDAQKQCWTIFNDRHGLLPVFFHNTNDRLVIAPMAWLAFQAGGQPLKINGHGVIDLLRTENITGENTLIQNVHWLIGGHALRWSHGKLSRHRYWDFTFSPDQKLREEDHIDRFAHALKHSLQRHARSQSPLLLGITGGLDSRLMLSFCQRMGKLPACFTAGWSFSEDVRFGRALARTVGTSHHWAPLKEQTLPEALADAIVRVDGLHSAAHLTPATAMLPYLQQQAGSVLLQGYMLGVLSGPYIPDDQDVHNAHPPHQSNWARARLHAGRDFATVEKLLHPQHATDSRQRWQTMVDHAYAAAPVNNPLKKAEYAILSGRSGRIDVPGTRLLQENALVRCPGCDKHMLDWYATVSPHMWRGKRPFATLFRWRFPATAAIPRSGTGGLPISDDWLWREYCWQREKISRWWTHRRHPWTRAWGISGSALRAWTFHHWQKSGALDVLIQKDARILEWIDRSALLKNWQQALKNPLQGSMLLNLATAEIMIRRLEKLEPIPSAQPTECINLSPSPSNAVPTLA